MLPNPLYPRILWSRTSSSVTNQHRVTSGCVCLMSRPNKTLLCSRRPQGPHMLFALCSITRWQLRWLTSCMISSLSRSCSTQWSSGCHISIQEWWTNQVQSKLLHPLLHNSLWRTRGRSSYTHITTYMLLPRSLQSEPS